MIGNDIIQARIKRSGLIDLAGDFYFNPSNFDKIEEIALDNSINVIFGLYASPDCWTVVSTSHVYFKTKANSGNLSVVEASSQFHEFHFAKGKEFDCEFIVLNNEMSIWVINSGVSCAMQNIFLLLKKIS